jgi:hypothetical protein
MHTHLSKRTRVMVFLGVCLLIVAVSADAPRRTTTSQTPSAGQPSPTVQQRLDALAATGGVVQLPCGTFSGPALAIPNSVALVGSGPCTEIPPVSGTVNQTTRMFNVRNENLTIDGSLIADPYIAIDFRRISASAIRNVRMINVRTCVLLSTFAYYNLIEASFCSASETGIEVWTPLATEGANQNMITGGKIDAPVALWIHNANGVGVFGTSLEGPSVVECRRLTGEYFGANFHGVRCEGATFGPTWYNDNF